MMEKRSLIRGALATLFLMILRGVGRGGGRWGERSVRAGDRVGPRRGTVQARRGGAHGQTRRAAQAPAVRSLGAEVALEPARRLSHSSHGPISPVQPTHLKPK